MTPSKRDGVKKDKREISITLFNGKILWVLFAFFVLFYGEPDLHGAIITYLTK